MQQYIDISPQIVKEINSTSYSNFRIWYQSLQTTKSEFMILSSLPSLTTPTIDQIASMTTTKLTAKNYLAWKDRILPLFENVNLLDHISTKVEEPQKYNIVGDRSRTQPTQLGGKMISL